MVLELIFKPRFHSKTRGLFFLLRGIYSGAVISGEIIEYFNRVDGIADITMIFKGDGFDQALIFQKQNRNYSWPEHV